jgi:hypothetical protein
LPYLLLIFLGGGEIKRGQDAQFNELPGADVALFCSGARALASYHWGTDHTQASMRKSRSDSRKILMRYLE